MSPGITQGTGATDLSPGGGGTIPGSLPVLRDPTDTPGFTVDQGTGVSTRNPATTGGPTGNIDPVTGETTTGTNLTTTVNPFNVGENPGQNTAPSLSVGGPGFTSPPGGGGPPAGMFPPGFNATDPNYTPPSTDQGAWDAWAATPAGQQAINDIIAKFGPQGQGQGAGFRTKVVPGGGGDPNLPPSGSTLDQLSNLPDYGGTPPQQYMGGLPVSEEVKNSYEQLLSRIPEEAMSGSPADLNALVQSMLGLSNLPAQQYFQSQFPGAVGGVRDMFNLASQRGTQEYEMPNVPNLGAAQVYEEGAAGAGQMQHIIDQIGRTQAPLDNLAALAKMSAEYTEGRGADMVNPYLADLEADYERELNDLESSLAARGMTGSTQADEARKRLRESMGRAKADAELKFYTQQGAERRADFASTGDLLGNLFGQQMEGSEFALDKFGQQGAAVGQAEGMDLGRRGAEASRSQQQYENLLGSLMGRENIDMNRLQMMQQPLGMLLSALSGTNVAPGTVGPLQMPQQRPPGPGAGELFGGLLGNLITGGMGAYGSYLGRKPS